jgi:hypothetical protein
MPLSLSLSLSFSLSLSRDAPRPLEFGLVRTLTHTHTRTQTQTHGHRHRHAKMQALVRSCEYSVCVCVCVCVWKVQWGGWRTCPRTYSTLPPALALAADRDSSERYRNGHPRLNAMKFLHTHRGGKRVRDRILRDGKWGMRTRSSAV